MRDNRNQANSPPRSTSGSAELKTESFPEKRANMRLIGVIDDAKQAQQLSAFLLTEGIENRVDLNDENKSEVWVKDEDQFKEALRAFGDHQSNPKDLKYVAAVDGAIKLVKDCLLYTCPSPRDRQKSRMPSSA